MSLVFHSDGAPKNAAALAECRRWGVSTAMGLARARRAAASAFSRKPRPVSKRALNLCGQNPNGTFAEGNTCAAGGSSVEGQGGGYTVKDESRPPREPGVKGFEYDATALAAAGPPEAYEGAELVDGQVLWDRYSAPSDINMKDAPDAKVSDASAAALFGYSDAASARRQQAMQAMPLRQQVVDLVRDGAVAMGFSDEEATKRASAFSSGDRPRDFGEPEVHSLAWTARQFSSSITNEIMVEMSRARPRTPKQELEYLKLHDRMKRATPDEIVPTPKDISDFVQAARTTPLRPGTVLWHGWEIKSFAEREKLDSLVAARAQFTNDTLLSTTTIPSLAANFGKQDSFSGDLIKAKSSHYMTRDGAMATVIRIRGQKHGLPIGAVSHYPNEAEITLAPSTFRFVKKTIVWMPTANDSGWPQETFRTADQEWDEESRVLFPVAVYDVEPVEASP